MKLTIVSDGFNGDLVVTLLRFVELNKAGVFEEGFAGHEADHSVRVTTVRRDRYSTEINTNRLSVLRTLKDMSSR